MTERPSVYVHSIHNPDEIRSFYEIPDALAALVRRGDERRTFTECLADLVEPAGDRGGVCGCGNSPQGPRGEEGAVYLLDVKITVVGPAPTRYNRAAPEFSGAMHLAVDAAQDALRQQGYEIARTGYGSYRLDDEDGNV